MDIPVIGRVTWGGVLLGVIIGVVFAGSIRNLPVLDKLPNG